MPEVNAMNNILLAAGVFLACLVEALTVVLAVGTARNWRAAWQGVTAGMVILVVIVAVLGRTLTIIPIGNVRLVVGTLLLIFGLQWLRKAVLRASGYKALHDENQIFAKQTKIARSAGKEHWGIVSDWYAFTVAFKSVLLEGLEVAFIVITFGVSEGNFLPAIIGAVAAIILVVAIGVALRHPLARIPENTLKFCVGALLTSFGTFWSGEGVGVKWPGRDTALLGLLALYTGIALLLVKWFTRTRNERPGAVA
jgi:uncharacterized membrane protein